MIKDYSYLQNEKQSAEFIRRNLPKLAKTANERLRKLEKAGINVWAYESALDYLSETDRRRFTAGKKSRSEKELRREFNKLLDFLTAESSTITGYKNIRERRIQALTDKLDTGVSNKRAVYDFLSSEQFKSLRKYVDSNQVLEDFVEALNTGFSQSEIQKGYHEFLESRDMTFEQVEEKRIRSGQRIIR